MKNSYTVRTVINVHALALALANVCLHFSLYSSGPLYDEFAIRRGLWNGTPSLIEE